MSAKDVCFPRKFLPAVLKDLKGSHAKYVSRLATNLKDLRFRALDTATEQKEILREAHDGKRSSHLAVNFAEAVKRGSIVCVHKH